jgi:hypothetical protein
MLLQLPRNSKGEEKLTNTSNKKDVRTEKIILTIVKMMQPITDDNIYLEFNEINEQKLSFKEIKDRLKKMKQLEKIGETLVDYNEREIWQVKEE